MNDVKKITKAFALRGEIVVPGDKSVSHRSVMLSGLGDRAVRITNFLPSADCLSTVECMRRMGVSIDEISDTELVVHGVGLHGLKEPEEILDAGNSGTTLRLLLGILAPQPFLATFTGDASLRKRPMGRVLTPLRQMGARLEGRDDSKRLPIAVLKPEKMHGISYDMPVASAQVKSAILFAGLYAEGETTVNEPYMSRNHTENMLRSFGADVRIDGKSVTVHKTERLAAPEHILVPGDISSAAFWLVAASIIPQSELTLKNVGINPTRTGILDVLSAMGADIRLYNRRTSGGEDIADLNVRSAKLHGTSLGEEIMPRLIDEIPAIAVAAMFAKGRTVIEGAGELRVKETDRLAAIAEEFNKFSDCITETKEGLIIENERPLQYAQCSSRGDHRIAMALAIAGAAGSGAAIEDGACVNISYPTFYETLQQLAGSSDGGMK